MIHHRELSEIYVCSIVEGSLTTTLETIMQSITFWSQTYYFAFITCHMFSTFESFQLLVVTGVLEWRNRREVTEIGHSCLYLNLMLSNHLVLCSNKFIFICCCTWH